MLERAEPPLDKMHLLSGGSGLGGRQVRKWAITRHCGQSDDVCSRDTQEGYTRSWAQNAVLVQEKLTRESAHLTNVLEYFFLMSRYCSQLVMSIYSSNPHSSIVRRHRGVKQLSSWPGALGSHSCLHSLLSLC